jgi:hypothetical protein
MKRYGDNLPSSHLEESENQNGKAVQYMQVGCAVRQDMVAFIMPADTPKKQKDRNLLSIFRFGQKKTKEHGV